MCLLEEETGKFDQGRSIQEGEALHKSRFSCLYGLSNEHRTLDTTALLCSGYQHRCGQSDHFTEQPLIPGCVFVLAVGSVAAGFPAYGVRGKSFITVLRLRHFWVYDMQ